MEVAIDTVDGPIALEGADDDLYLSVRCGAARRQLPMSKALLQPISFPADIKDVASCNIKFDLLSKVGSSCIVLRPGEERYIVTLGSTAPAATQRLSLASAGATIGCSAPPRRCTRPTRLRVRVSQRGALAGTSKPPANAAALDVERCGSSQSSSATDAYLEAHQLLPFFQALLRTLIREKPDDPYAFMAAQLPQWGCDAAARGGDCGMCEATLEEAQMPGSSIAVELAEAKKQNRELREEAGALRARVMRFSTPSGVATRASRAKVLRRPTVLTSEASMEGESPSGMASEQVLEDRTHACTRRSRPINQKFWKGARGENDSAEEFRVLRQSVFNGRWTLYSAGGKATKPHQYAHSRNAPYARDLPDHDEFCPFCRGNEGRTPFSLLSFDGRGELCEGPQLPEDWRVRVIPNIFPLLVTPSGFYSEEHFRHLMEIPHSAAARGLHDNKDLYPTLQRSKSRDDPEGGLNRQINAIGYSEVIIENSAHNGLLAIVDKTQVALSLRALQLRGKVLVQQPRVRQLLYFKQYGSLSGGSLAHPHMQVVTLPLVTPEMQNRLTQALDFHQRWDQCVVCRCLIQEPLKQGSGCSTRLVHVSKHFVTVVPYACNPYRTTIVPRRHGCTWLETTREEVEDLAAVLQLVMESIYNVLDDPDYNIFFHSVDKEEELCDYGREAVHWTLEIQCRFPGSNGGVELASGIRIAGCLPEDWAKMLSTEVQRLTAQRDLDGARADVPCDRLGS